MLFGSIFNFEIKIPVSILVKLGIVDSPNEADPFPVSNSAKGALVLNAVFSKANSILIQQPLLFAIHCAVAALYGATLTGRLTPPSHSVGLFILLIVWLSFLVADNDIREKTNRRLLGASWSHVFGVAGVVCWFVANVSKDDSSPLIFFSPLFIVPFTAFIALMHFYSFCPAFALAEAKAKASEKT